MKWAAIYIRSCIILQASLPMMLSLSTCYNGLMYSSIYIAIYTKLNDVDFVDSFLSVCYSQASNQLQLYTCICPKQG